jgi:hypothetical protein
MTGCLLAALAGYMLGGGAVQLVTLARSLARRRATA